MESSFTLVRVRGIPIGVNWSWLAVFGLLTWSLASDLFPRAYPHLDRSVYVGMAIATELLFFTSIVLHELGHAFRAIREGMRIEGITLWLFGGVARFKGSFPNAGAEFRIAIAGPIVSFVIASGFAILGRGGRALGWPAAILGVADYLAQINAIVAGFNLLPALPLDGGRVFRAWLWARKRDFMAATLTAARVSRTLGGAMVALGLFSAVTGSGVGGLWFVMLGWFLIQAAAGETALAMMQRTFRGVRVRDLMTPDPDAVTPDLDLAGLTNMFVHGHGHSVYPVVDGGRAEGLVSVRRVKEIPAGEWPTTTVRSIMVPLEKAPVVRADDGIMDALQALGTEPGRALVMEGGRVVGIVSNADLRRALEIESLRGSAG
jgi:Zn-dependent protease